MLHIYCGEGKGKTTAAMGLAVRAAGGGKKVLILQFLKDGSSSEFSSLKKIENLQVVPQTKFFGFTWTLSDTERAEAAAYYMGLLEDAFARAKEIDLLVLDEALGACAAGMLDEGRLRELLAQRPQAPEVVLTGRGPSEELVALADYVTEMKKIKHPFDRGIAARPGIEY